MDTLSFKVQLESKHMWSTEAELTLSNDVIAYRSTKYNREFEWSNLQWMGRYLEVNEYNARYYHYLLMSDKTKIIFLYNETGEIKLALDYIKSRKDKLVIKYYQGSDKHSDTQAITEAQSVGQEWIISGEWEQASNIFFGSLKQQYQYTVKEEDDRIVLSNEQEIHRFFRDSKDCSCDYKSGFGWNKNCIHKEALSNYFVCVSHYGVS